MRVGWIYRHEAFYLDRETGQLQPKYLIALAYTTAGDIVARVLTSRAHGRPEEPPCYQGDPYPGYYLGVPGVPLTVKSWVDLRGLDDIDEDQASVLLRKRVLNETMELPLELLLDLLECVAGAGDTTRMQERAIRDQLARLR